MIKKLLVGAAVLLTLPTFLSAQGMHSCGTIHDQASFDLMNNRAKAHRQLLDEGYATERDDDITYIPISYHVIARADGTAGARPSNILGLHCKLNEEYAPHDIQFYMNDGIDFLYSDVAYDNPGDQPFYLNNNRANDAINVWIGNKADVSGQDIGVTLGYYDPQWDWLVIRKSEANYVSETLAHEVGHFLSLNHPFFGWDCTYYEAWQAETGETCALNTAPCFNIATERQNGSNCSNSADYICDTPPDFNLGFQASGCSYNGPACDSNGDQVEPMATNIMSYFSGCEDPEFTDGQVEMMFADYESNARNYIRTDGGPTTVEAVTELPSLTAPENAAVLSYSNVTVSWNEVPNAEYYIVETALNSGFSVLARQVVAQDNYIQLEGLNGGNTYFWRVQAFNELGACADWSEVRTFTAGNGQTAVRSIAQISDFVVVPNPATVGSDINMLVTASEAFSAEIKVIDLAGKELAQQSKVELTAGQNIIELPSSNLAAGLYFAVIRSEKGVINKKFVVSE